ncbi:hypothetical protein SNEBB_009437 [Seison nebaliae]|nr:hypothetical protein SNEBB_009437 [Seison nebaliae]
MKFFPPISYDTCHGVAAISLSRNKRNKFFWILASLLAGTLMMWMIRINIKDYRMHKTVMMEKKIIDNFVPFPSITICSGNQFKLKSFDDNNITESRLIKIIESIIDMKMNNLNARGEVISNLYYDVLLKINERHRYTDEFLPPTRVTISEWYRIQTIYAYFSTRILQKLNCINCFQIITRTTLRFSNLINYLNLTENNQFRSPITYDEIMEDDIAMQLTNDYYKLFSKIMEHLSNNLYIDIRQFASNFRRKFRLNRCTKRRNYTMNLFEIPTKKFMKRIEKKYGGKEIPLPFYYDIQDFLCSFQIIMLSAGMYRIERLMVIDMKQMIDYFALFYVETENYIWDALGTQSKILIDKYNEYFPDNPININTDVTLSLVDFYSTQWKKDTVFTIRQLTNDLWRSWATDLATKYKIDNIYHSKDRNYSLMNILESRGWNLNDDVVHCTFSQHRCKKNMFNKVYSSNGLCYQLDLKKNLTPVQTIPLKQVSPGILFGFELRFVDSQTDSIRLYIHSPQDIPSMELKGLVLKKNYRYNIRIEMDETKLVDQSDLCNNQENYTVSNCYEECMEGRLEKMCGCRLFSRSGNHTSCSTIRHIYCLFVSDHIFLRKEKRKRLCPSCIRKCHSTDYIIKDISSSKLSLYDDIFHSFSNGTMNTKLSENQYQISVYFSRIEHRLLEEHILISSSNLFPLIGGTMCFCIGINLLTIYVSD